MGVDDDDIYIVNYLSNNGHHSVLAVQNPDDPDQVIKINYGEMVASDGETGATALTQHTSLPNVGLNYRIFDANGSPIGSVPSELQSVLRDVTGASPGFIEVSPYSLNTLGVQTTRWGTLRAFTGTTSSGDQIVGAAYDHSFSSGINQTELGLAVARSDKNHPYLELSQDMIYARLQQSLHFRGIQTGPIQSEIYAGAQSEILATNVRTHYPGESEAHDLDSEARAIAETAVIVRQFGTAATFGLGYETDNGSLSGRYTTPIGNTSSIMPENYRSIALNADRNIGSMRYNLGFERDLDRRQNRLNLGGSLQW